MASSNSNSSPPSLEELCTISATNLIGSWIFSQAAERGPTPRQVAVLLDRRSIEIIPFDVEPVDGESSSVQGSQPSLKASIESLSRVKVSDPDLECPICLSEYEIERELEAKKMPCGHLFHFGCIDKWLGIHGVCPVCRFRMPVEEERGEVEREGQGDEDDEGEGLRIHFVFARANLGMELNSNSEGGEDEVPSQHMERDYSG